MPVTAEVKVCVAPARTFALDGITLTTTCGGGGGVEVLVIPAQLERIRISIIAGPMSARRIKFFMWFWRRCANANADAAENVY